MKVAYNACHGGFGLSEKAERMLAELKGIDLTGSTWHGGWFQKDNKVTSPSHDDRADADLIKVIESLGGEANGMYANLAIKEIPDGAEYEITEYDGFEDVEPPRMNW